MTITINESSMDFVFDDQGVYLPEKDLFYVKLQQKEIKICDFIQLKNNKLDFIEAKTNCPNPNNTANQENIDKFKKEIVFKFQHTLNICLAVLYNSAATIKTHQDGYNRSIINQNSNIEKIRILLVVKLLDKPSCNTWTDILKSLLNFESKIFNADILVINEDIAKTYNLCT